MRIREATLTDVPALVRLGEAFRSGSPYRAHIPANAEKLSETFSAIIARENGVIFVGEADSVLVGMIVLLLQPHIFSGELVAQELVWWVDPSFRGAGLKLLKVAEAWARANGAVRLQVSAPNASVERVYEHFGYQYVESSWYLPLAQKPAIRVFDDVLPDPEAYRRYALDQEFKTIAPGSVFHGIAENAPPDLVTPFVCQVYPQAHVTSSFFRRSPHRQEEPTFIHTDVDMGDWTAILYLTPDAPSDDGTIFWKDRETGAIAGTPVHDAHREERLRWMDVTRWKQWHKVDAVFNRLVVFPAPYFHSRAIHDNYGSGESARLIQLLFGVMAERPQEARCVPQPS